MHWYFYILSMCWICVCERDVCAHVCVLWPEKELGALLYYPHIIPSRKSLLKNPELGWQSASSRELPIFAPRQQWGYKPSLLSLLHSDDLSSGPHASAASPLTSWAIPPAPKMHFDLRYFQHSVSLSWGLQQRINNTSFALIVLDASIRVLFP